MNLPEWVLFSLNRFTPELVLAGAVVLVVLADLVPRLRGGWTAFLGIFGVAASLFALVRQEPLFAADPATTFLGAYAFDRYSGFFKAAFLGATLLVLILSAPTVRSWGTGRGEFSALILSCTFGMCLMAGANDLLMMYLSLEFVSITSYILAAMLRHNRKSAEAGLKYILYGAAASGLMIYGMSFLYGVTGTLNVPELGARLAALETQPHPTFFLITSVLILAGFAYKIAAVPFHMWCPDVYEGAPTPVTAFFSVGPKAAGFAMLARFLAGAFGMGPSAAPFEWTIVIALLCVMTMTVGNFAALQQQNLKRLFAYSSIAHAGYLLLAFTVFTPASVATLMFYLVVYVIMNLGAFLVVIVLEEGHGIETVDGCRGLGWRSPALAGLMTIFLFSLTGLPPTAGFWGKFYLFTELLRSGRALPIALVVTAAVFTVVSLYYYARIVAAMFLSKPPDAIPASRRVLPVHALLLWILAAATLILGLQPSALLEFAKGSAAHFLGAK